MVPSEKLHTGYQPSESPQEMEEGEKKGPSCQNCGELLLSSTAHVCGKCSHPHREKTVEKLLEKKKKDDQSSKTTSQQYQPVFGQSTTDGLACATNQKNNGSTGSSRKRHSNLNSNNKLNTDSGSDSELFVDAPSEFVAGSSPQEPPSKVNSNYNIYIAIYIHYSILTLYYYSFRSTERRTSLMYYSLVNQEKPLLILIVRALV